MTKKNKQCKRLGVCSVHFQDQRIACNPLEGAGIASFIKRRIHTKPRDHATARFASFMNDEGSQIVRSLRVGRIPIGFTKALNVLSLGGFDRVRKRLNYDDVYHQYLIATLTNGSCWRLEKNHVIEAKRISSPKPSRNEAVIPVPPHTTLRSLISNAANNNASFWNYDPASNNCQSFVSGVIHSNNLHLPPAAEEIAKKQDGVRLIDSLPGRLKELPGAVTHLAGIGDRVIYGDGFKLQAIRCPWA